MNLTKTNLVLSLILMTYIFCSTKYIDRFDTIFQNKYYLLFLLIAVLVVYPYHKQCGITILIIALVTHLPVFKERFVGCKEMFLNPNDQESQNNNLETVESNFKEMIESRKKETINKKIQEQMERMNILEEQGIITPLENEIVREIQRKFENELDYIYGDFEELSKYTDEGDPVNAGLLPREIQKNKLDYNNLVKTGQIIYF